MNIQIYFSDMRKFYGTIEQILPPGDFEANIPLRISMYFWQKKRHMPAMVLWRFL